VVKLDRNITYFRDCPRKSHTNDYGSVIDKILCFASCPRFSLNILYMISNSMFMSHHFTTAARTLFMSVHQKNAEHFKEGDLISLGNKYRLCLSTSYFLSQLER
jgi:hypothetical protein